MKKLTDDEILAKLKEVWVDEFYCNDKKTKRFDAPDFEVEHNDGDYVCFKVSRMYDSPGLTFEQLKTLAEFFGTEKINDDDRISESGCESCDYGSEYGFRLTVRPTTPPEKGDSHE